MPKIIVYLTRNLHFTFEWHLKNLKFTMIRPIRRPQGAAERKILLQIMEMTKTHSRIHWLFKINKVNAFHTVNHWNYMKA